MMRWKSGLHYVYECRQAGTLVYVGCTGSPRQRIKGLRRLAWWTSDTDVLIVAALPRREALDYEVARIKALRPVHNRQANPDHGAPCLNAGAAS